VTHLEQFLFEEACRLEQTAALTGRAREFLKEQRVREPAEFGIARIVGEQRARGCDAHFTRQTESHRSYGRACVRSLVAQQQLPAGAVPPGAKVVGDSVAASGSETGI
jgi:hypothetical protein